MSETAYIALGANLGDRAGNIAAALEGLGRVPGVTLTKVSTMMENPAMGGPVDSPAFLNAAAEVVTSLSPEALLEAMLAVERSLGRVRTQKWGPRTIDLDLLLYGDRAIDAPGLTVPHPLMHQRRFVLEPLAQIAPQVVHPVLGQTIQELWERSVGA
ncbi:MAG TPA: 2-amino-4-hydroxy-6-hydroxymethyldihydropteridine diphosphokinase [Tepidisphaeraceae bacterium]|jgi:2-amino-4-hydroxy-6-hydroxymethyldihydropteridine diphosphokinase